MHEHFVRVNELFFDKREKKYVKLSNFITFEFVSYRKSDRQGEDLSFIFIVLVKKVWNSNGKNGSAKWMKMKLDNRGRVGNEMQSELRF